MPGQEEQAHSARWEFTPNCRFVLCEGADDKGLLETIAKLPGMPNVQVRHAAECNERATGGRPGFGHAINEFSIVTNYRLVQGFVIVTDNDSPNAFNETCQQLGRMDICRPPASHDRFGELDGRPLKIILLPNNEYGDLEKLCLEVLRARWPSAKDTVPAFLRSTGAEDWANEASKNKAHSRATIVGYNEADPYKGLGHLFRMNELDIQHPSLEWLVRSFRELDSLLGLA